MKVTFPFYLDGDNNPCLDVGEAVLTLIDVDIDHENRDLCTFELMTPAFTYVDDNMRSGVGGSGTVDKFETFLSFMSACGESRNYRDAAGRMGDNANLYPEHVGEWIVDNLSDIESTQFLICDGTGNPHHTLIDEGDPEHHEVTSF
jgi:hypothetical protein